jgi:hypothetical protein
VDLKHFCDSIVAYLLDKIKSEIRTFMKIGERKREGGRKEEE